MDSLPSPIASLSERPATAKREPMTSDPARPEARTPRGFIDRRARDLTAERKILAAVAEVYERYGFEALETGAFEYADALGKFLPDADRPNEGVFALQDDDEQWMALPPWARPGRKPMRRSSPWRWRASRPPACRPARRW